MLLHVFLSSRLQEKLILLLLFNRSSLRVSRTERVNSIHDLKVFGSLTLAAAWHADWCRGSKADLPADRPIVPLHNRPNWLDVVMSHWARIIWWMLFSKCDKGGAGSDALNGVAAVYTVEGEDAFASGCN
jgi:hypothetical protein